MSQAYNPSPSAPECQLSHVGTEQSYSILLNAAQRMSGDELSALEDDLDYYSKTGLIGVSMSKLLAILQDKGSVLAA